MSILVRTASSQAVKPRSAWSFLVLKGKSFFEVHIMWKDSRNCLELYKMRGKDKIKKQFGLVAKAEVVDKNNDSGVLAQYYQVKNEYGDTINFKSSLMNPGIVGLNAFTKKILEFRSAGKDVELSTFISQLCKSKDFSQHNEDVHTKFGQLMEVTKNDEDVNELEKFWDAARECAISVTSTADAAVGLIAENTKRRKKADVKNKTTPKLGKQERIEKYFRQEIVDPEGIEQKVVKKGFGRSDIPIDCLTVCQKVKLPIYDEKVNTLAKEMLECFDATQMYLTVVPVELELFDPIKLDNNLYEVVQGRHRILALQKLDQENKLSSLPTLGNRTVTCFIIGVSDDVAVNYLWHRGNTVAAKFVFTPSHHDLLFTLQGLKLINSEGEQVMKAVERYASLQKKSDAEKLALRNFSKWPNDALDLLKQVLLKYQNYQTADTDDKLMKKSFTKLQRGEKLITPISLFREVSKLPPGHFKESSKEILDGKMSLKDLAKKHSKDLERRKKEALIMENSGYQSFQSLKDQYPDHFSDTIIEKLPINSKSSSSNQPSLESYTKSVCNKKEMKEESSSQQQLKLIELNADLVEITSLLGRARRKNVQDMLKNNLKAVQDKLKEEVSDPYVFNELEKVKIGQLDGHIEEISSGGEKEELSDIIEDQAYDEKEFLSEFVEEQVDSVDNDGIARRKKRKYSLEASVQYLGYKNQEFKGKEFDDSFHKSTFEATCLDERITVDSIIKPESDWEEEDSLTCSIRGCGDNEISYYSEHFVRNHKDLPLNKIRVNTEQGKILRLQDVASPDIMPHKKCAARDWEELFDGEHGDMPLVGCDRGPARGGYQCMAYDGEVGCSAIISEGQNGNALRYLKYKHSSSLLRDLVFMNKSTVDFLQILNVFSWVLVCNYEKCGLVTFTNYLHRGGRLMATHWEKEHGSKEFHGEICKSFETTSLLSSNLTNNKGLFFDFENIADDNCDDVVIGDDAAAAENVDVVFEELKAIRLKSKSGLKPCPEINMDANTLQINLVSPDKQDSRALQLNIFDETSKYMCSAAGCFYSHIVGTLQTQFDKEHQDQPNRFQVVINEDKIIKSVPVSEAAPAEQEDVDEAPTILDFFKDEDDYEKKQFSDIIEDKIDEGGTEVVSAVIDEEKASRQKRRVFIEIAAKKSDEDFNDPAKRKSNILTSNVRPEYETDEQMGD